jgi:hypothetical protein
MKKIALLAVFLLAIGLVAGVAEDKPLTLSGSVDFSIGDDDVALAPGAAFSGAKTGAVASFKLGTASDKVEAGVTLNLAPAITLTAGADAMPAATIQDYDGTGYEFLQELCDYAYYMINGKTYLNDAGGQTAFVAMDPELWDAGNEAVITGTGPWTVTDLDDIAETVTLSAELRAIYTAALVELDTTLTAVEGTLSSWILDGNIVLEGAAGPVAAAQEMQTFYDDAYAYIWGDDTDDTWASSFPVTSAYLKVKKIAGVVDIMAEIEGKAVGVGSMVTSDATSGNDANYGVTLALSEGVVAGLTASVLVTGSDADMAAAVSEDYETVIVDAAAASEPVWGGQVEFGYATKMFGATVQFGVVDLTDFAAWQASIQPFLSMPDVAGLSVKGEFDLLGGATMGMAAGASVGASIMGIAPSVGFYWKNAAFGGDASTNDVTGADDLTTDSGLMAEFNSIDAADAAALAIALSVDLKDLMKMKLVTLTGGFDMMLIGGTENGWNAGVAFDLAEVLKAPLTASFNISKWAAEDLLWSGALGYTYDKLGVTFTLEQTEADVIGWSLAGKVSF